MPDFVARQSVFYMPVKNRLINYTIRNANEKCGVGRTPHHVTDRRERWRRGNTETVAHGEITDLCTGDQRHARRHDGWRQ